MSSCCWAVTGCGTSSHHSAQWSLHEPGQASCWLGAHVSLVVAAQRLGAHVSLVVAAQTSASMCVSVLLP
jgi:hypothetical protein